MLTFVILAIFIALFLAGVPVVIAMLGACLGALLYLGQLPLVLIPQIMISGMNKYELLAVPFFILAAEIMNAGGITDRIFRTALALAGRGRAGLAQVNIIASLIFAGISGSAIADAAGLGRVEYKAMIANGYDPEFSCGVTLASSLVGPLIPPSVIMILFAILAEVSVGGMLLAGILPGLVLALALLISVRWLIATGRVEAPMVERMSAREKLSVLIDGLPAILAPVVLVGGLVSGIVTTTEAGVAACVYSLFIAIVFYRELTWARFAEVIKRSVLSSGLVMTLIGAGSVLAWIITWDQGAEAVGRWFAGLTDQLWAQLILINLFLLIVGCLIEGVPALLILIPILMPMTHSLGVDPIHFGVIMIFNLLVGLVTPPVGLGLYVMANVTGLSVERVIRSTLPFFTPLIAVLLLVTFVPWLSLFLPRLLLP